jgi:hypothetical protein
VWLGVQKFRPQIQTIREATERCKNCHLKNAWSAIGRLAEGIVASIPIKSWRRGVNIERSIRKYTLRLLGNGMKPIEKKSGSYA